MNCKPNESRPMPSKSKASADFLHLASRHHLWPGAGPALRPRSAPKRGEVIAIESYKEGEADVGAQLKRMKAEDLKRYGLSVPVDQTKLTGKVTKLDKKVFYTPGFDAIFIPGRATDAGIITSQLNFHDMKVPFLGANGWNSPDFARTDDSSIDGAVFVDGFFVDSPDPDRAGLCRSIQEAIRYQPHTLFNARLRCREIGTRCGSKRRCLRRSRPRPSADTAGPPLPCGTGGVRARRDPASSALPHTNQTRPIHSSQLTRIDAGTLHCNHRPTATTSLRPAGSPLGPSPYCWG